MTQRLLRIAKVARYLEMSEVTVRRLIRGGIIPAVRIGRGIRVDPEALREYVKRGGTPLEGAEGGAQQQAGGNR